VTCWSWVRIRKQPLCICKGKAAYNIPPPYLSIAKSLWAMGYEVLLYFDFQQPCYRLWQQNLWINAGWFSCMTLDAYNFFLISSFSFVIFFPLVVLGRFFILLCTFPVINFLSLYFEWPVFVCHYLSYLCLLTFPIWLYALFVVSFSMVLILVLLL